MFDKYLRKINGLKEREIHLILVSKISSGQMAFLFGGLWYRKAHDGKCVLKAELLKVMT